MAYDATHLAKLSALKALAEKVKADYATKQELSTLSGKVDGLITTGGQPNVIEGVKVNGSLLTLTGKIADILIKESTANGKISVNNVDVAVHGLAALAYKANVAYDDLATALKNLIDSKAAQSDLDTLTGTGDGSIQKMIDAAINKFATDVTDDDVVNSYKELIDWVAKHGPEATKMAQGISDNKTAIADLKKFVGELPKGATSTTVVAYIAEAINALSIGDYAKTADVNTALGNYYKKTEVDTALGKKADKVANATAGNFAGLDANGNLTDSGKKAADFVAAEAGKRLMTDAEGTKLGGIANGATKVETSTTNGNIKINGAEKTVYTLPSDVVKGAVATDDEVTEMLTEVFGAAQA